MQPRVGACGRYYRWSACVSLELAATRIHSLVLLSLFASHAASDLSDTASSVLHWFRNSGRTSRLGESETQDASKLTVVPL
jgi:hypothetical protein